jgi:succinate dehydrogenase / fumarate reductase membrane anchor subunit
MDSNSPRLLTPIAKVRGLGSAKDGTEHWLWQRITAMVLLDHLLRQRGQVGALGAAPR